MIPYINCDQKKAKYINNRLIMQCNDPYYALNEAIFAIQYSAFLYLDYMIERLSELEYNV